MSATSTSQPPVVPKLSDLCLETIASSMEKYPPHCFSYLAESEWDEIIRKKHRNTAPGQIKAKAGGASCRISAPVVLSGGLDGRGRTIPAVADKILTEIEKENPHLSRSAISDELVWRDCVEYKFRSGGMSRPRVFRYPWPMLVEKLKSSGDALLHVLMPPPCGLDEEGCSETSIREQREDKMMRSIQFLGNSIMSIELLAQSSVGKAVKRFIKECKKFVATDGGKSIPRWMPDILSPRPNLHLLSPVQYLDKLLSGWKDVASSSGVQITSTACNKDSGGRDRAIFIPDHFSGRNTKRTTEAEHREDVAVAMTCRQWRHIFQALSNRETAKISRHGEKMRKLREDLDSGRPKIGHVGTKSAKATLVITNIMQKQSRQEEILNKSRGTRARIAAATSGRSVSSGTTKMKALRQEVKLKSSRLGAVGSGAQRSSTAPPMRQTVVGASKSKKSISFGASVAAYASSSSSSAVAAKHARNASSSAPRGMVGKTSSRHIELSDGKRMGLPKPKSGVFAAIEEKKRKAAAMEAYAAKQRHENDMTPRFKKR